MTSNPRIRDHTRQRARYGAQHQALRAAWVPKVRTGRVDCHRPVCLFEREGGSRKILPGQAWDLGHDETDPTGQTYRGPEHARCNRGHNASIVNARRKTVDPEPKPVTKW